MFNMQGNARLREEDLTRINRLSDLCLIFWVPFYGSQLSMSMGKLALAAIAACAALTP